MHVLRLIAKRWTALFSVVALLVVIAGVSAACGEDVDMQQAKSNLALAQATVPVEPMDHFLAREALRFWRDTMNVPSKLWYVYRINDLGQYYAYNICDTVPLSYGVSTTSSVRIVGSYGAVVPAAGLDAVYWSGADPSLYYCRDAATGAMLHFLSSKAEWYDQPLDLEALGAGDIPIIQFMQLEE